jgi:membrane glycosyltransferase
MPKLAGYAELLFRPGRAGRAALLRCMGQELVLGLLLDPVVAMERTLTLLRFAHARLGSWAPQHRSAREITWPAAIWRFGLHMAAGLVLTLGFATGGVFALLTALPMMAGLILAVPLAVLTARPETFPRAELMAEAEAP